MGHQKQKRYRNSDTFSVFGDPLKEALQSASHFGFLVPLVRIEAAPCAAVSDGSLH